ncbi:uncharacterized protein LOC144579243 isoform X2 [Callithrix jacchus]
MVCGSKHPQSQRGRGPSRLACPPAVGPAEQELVRGPPLAMKQKEACKPHRYASFTHSSSPLHSRVGKHRSLTPKELE